MLIMTLRAPFKSPVTHPLKPLVAVLLLLCWTLPAWATVEREFEPEYSEAVLAFNARDYPKSVSILNELIKKSPKTSEFFELKALALKASNQEKEAADTYQALILAKTADSRPKAEIAPYAFELGMIRFKEKKYEQASSYFAFAQKYGFNESAAHFYSGLIQFQSSQWGEAEKNFAEVIASKIDELKPASHYYLAQCALKMDYPAGAIQSFISAKKASQSVLDDPQSTEDMKQISRQILDGSDQSLAPFDKSQFFGNLTELTGYDSNVLSVPSSVTDAVEASGKHSLKEILAAGVGYASSPLKTFQFVPSYRGSINKNFNGDSKSGEFAESDVSLFVTKGALEKTSYGAKVEAEVLFQNDLNPVTNSSTYRRYSQGFTFGPYLKREIKPKYVLGGELFIKPQKFYRDPTSSDLSRTGTLTTGRIYLQNFAGRKYWNPVLALRFEHDDTNGNEYNAKSKAIQLSNALTLRNDIEMTALLDIDFVEYANRFNGERKDKIILLQVGASKRLTPKWTVLAATDYTINHSNIADTYSYNRFSFTAGASYSF